MIQNINSNEHIVMTQIARRVAKCTCQLYLFRDGRINIPSPHGCCVLVNLNNQFYCLSNAHVLGDGYLGHTFVFTSKNNLNGKGKTTTIDGQYFFTQLPQSGNREDDNIDMAIVQLTLECAEDLINRGYYFIEINDIETNYLAKAEDRLLIAGYPGSGTDVNTHLRRVIAKPFYLLTNPCLEYLKYLKYPKEFHTVARYTKGKVFNPRIGQIGKGPIPNGISGSGLWHIATDETGNQKAILIGILSTYFKNKNLVVSTKIEIFIDLIKQKFDPTIPNKGICVKILD